jgi:lipopolysaccharide transport system ATP-binding protein
MKPILEIQSISKKFIINHEQQPYLSLRDSLSNIFKSKKTKEDFWALKDVSFNIERGDTIGIIGKNGAGKSTLLKILSKITPPTSGKVIGRGRIASLLEVGTGFHPELSGRENIFMNGSILGMKRLEILKNFNSIIDFAGIEKFIDTPLKHYSSGMQLRLAFAVAAFLENEILIIDEVLAVGDSEFQKKCLGKMDDISKSGRTILFVSHQLGIVSKLCKKSLLLNKGQVHSFGDSETIIGNYFKLGSVQQNRFVRENNKVEEKEIIIKEVLTINNDLEPVEEYLFNQSIILKIKMEINEFIPGTHIGIALLDKMETRVFTVVRELLKEEINEKELIFKVKLQASIIAPNSYSFVVAAFVPNLKVIDTVENICRVTIVDSGTDLSKFEGIDYGSVIVNADWDL